MEERVRYLEQRVAAQDRTIIEKDKQISKLEGLEEGWFNNVEVGGVIEVEAFHASGDEIETENGLEVGKVEVGVAAELNDWVGAEIVLAMDDGVIVDTAVVTMEPEATPLSFSIGRQTVPFGVFESTLVSTPLTKVMGETAGDSVIVGFEAGGIAFAGYLFDGGNDRSGDTRVDNIGASAGWSMESDEVSFAFNVSVVDDIGESGKIAGCDDCDTDPGAGGDKVMGGGASVVGSFGNITLIAEYLAALDKFDASELPFNNRGAEPSAWVAEGAFAFDVYGRPSTAALGWQGTREAEGLELPETRFLVGLAVEMADGVSLGLEWRRDENYDGNSAQQATALLATSF